MKLLEIINDKPKQLNEGVFSNLMNRTFGNGFKATVAGTIETLLNKTVDDLARASGKVTLKTIKSNENYINALKQSISEASIAKFKRPFNELTKAEGELLAKQVQDGLDAHLLDYSKKGGKLADADVAAARQAVDQTSDALKAGTAVQKDVTAATKNLVVNQKMATRVETMKKVLNGFEQSTRTQIINLLKKDIPKVVSETGDKVSQRVAGETTIYSGGKLFKISKDQLKVFPGKVKQVIVKRPVLSTLLGMGLTVAVLYLIFGDGTFLTDEGGKAIDDNGQANEFLPCIQELIKSGEGRMVTSTSGEISVLVNPSDYPGGIKFYTNGRVFDIAGGKKGKYKCKEGRATIAEQDLRPYAYQYVKNDNKTSQETKDSNVAASKIGLGNIEITWDTPSQDETTPRQSTYRDCNGKPLPHEFGCRSEQIKKAQICLGLPEKYQTGNFGPITKKAIEDKGIDTSNGFTQDILDKVCDKQTTPLNREPIQPITSDRLKIGDLKTPSVNIKLPNIKPLEVSPAQYYNAFRDNGNIVGEDGNNRIKYKGPDLDNTQLGRLDSALSDMGYTRIKQLEDLKRYGSKYVWLKQ